MRVSPKKRPVSHPLVVMSVITGFVAVVTGCTSNDAPPTDTSGSADPVGLWGLADSDVEIEIAPDGDLSGFDGCNAVNGTWEADGPSITLDFTGGTERFCPDVTDWLVLDITAVVRGETLVVTADSGLELGTFSRQPG